MKAVVVISDFLCVYVLPLNIFMNQRFHDLGGNGLGILPSFGLLKEISEHVKPCFRVMNWQDFGAFWDLKVLLEIIALGNFSVLWHSNGKFRTCEIVVLSREIVGLQWFLTLIIVFEYIALGNISVLWRSKGMFPRRETGVSSREIVGLRSSKRSLSGISPFSCPVKTYIPRAGNRPFDS